MTLHYTSPDRPGQRSWFSQLGPCDRCNGTRGEIVNGKRRDCVCVTRARIIDYLTPMFSRELRIRPEDGFNTTPYAKRNVFIQNDAKWPDMWFSRVYKTAVKSFLVNYALAHKRQISFYFCTGAKELVDAYFATMRLPDSDEAASYHMMGRVELLILFLGIAGSNEQYGRVMLELLQSREAQHTEQTPRRTWVITPYSLIPDDGMLDKVYGPDFVNYIKPRQTRDGPGVSGGNFMKMDLSPIVAALKQSKPAAA